MKADICGKCGGVLSANQKRTRFKCNYCGVEYNLPGAPILARSLRPSPPKEPTRLASADEVKPARERPKPIQKQSPTRPSWSLSDWIGEIVVRFLEAMAFALLRTIFTLICIAILVVGVGGVILLFRFRQDHPDRLWASDVITYGVAGCWVAGTAGLLLVSFLFRPRR